MKCGNISSIFFNSFSRDDEKLARQLEWNLRNDIMSKKSVEKDQLVFADPQSVQPLILFFTKHFRWMPDEYTLVLEVNTEPKKATVKKRFRFTLFESTQQCCETLHRNTQLERVSILIHTDMLGSPCLLLKHERVWRVLISSSEF